MLTCAERALQFGVHREKPRVSGRQNETREPPMHCETQIAEMVNESGEGERPRTRL